MSATTTFGFTEEQIDDLDLPPGTRVERLDGQLVMSPPPHPIHQQILSHLHNAVHVQLAGTGLSVIQGIAIGPKDQYLIPDLVVYYEPEPLPQVVPAKYIEIAVEVLSPSTRTNDLTNKVTAYREWGIRDYWIIDPDSQQLIRHRYRTPAVDFDDDWITRHAFSR